MPDNLRAEFEAWAAQNLPGWRPTNQDYRIWLAGRESGQRTNLNRRDGVSFMDPPGRRSTN